MKSLSITFNASCVTIPLGYHHQVQGLIYALLRSGGGEAMHEDSLNFGLRHYKLFTFSSLRGGKVSPDRKSLHFDGSAYLDVRSVRPEFCDALLSGLVSDRPFHLFGRTLTVRSIKINDPLITESSLRIKMLSPLTVHKTDEGGFSEFLSPMDSIFSEEINRNFARKYHAFTGAEPASKISIQATAVGPKDRYVTLYQKAGQPGGKDIYITGWRGEYELTGRADYLNFLYYCGLGARNSDGFGLFEVI